jgi:hypothetical protein
MELIGIHGNAGWSYGDICLVVSMGYLLTKSWYSYKKYNKIMYLRAYITKYYKESLPLPGSI